MHRQPRDRECRDEMRDGMQTPAYDPVERRMRVGEEPSPPITSISHMPDTGSRTATSTRSSSARENVSISARFSRADANHADNA